MAALTGLPPSQPGPDQPDHERVWLPEQNHCQIAIHILHSLSPQLSHLQETNQFSHVLKVAASTGAKPNTNISNQQKIEWSNLGWRFFFFFVAPLLAQADPVADNELMPDLGGFFSFDI